MIKRLLSITLVLTLLLGYAHAQRQLNLKLIGGAATVDEVIIGGRHIDFNVRVGAGQTLAVTMRAGKDSTAPVFNVISPGSTNALFIGSESESGKMAPRMMPITGTYVIRVYQMGGSKDENESNAFTMGVRITGTELKPLPPSKDQRLAGTGLHAIAKIECEIANDPSHKLIQGSVTKRGNGSATIELKAGNIRRTLLFVHGKLLAHDSQEKFTSEVDADQIVVRFGDGSELYRIPDVLLYGG